MGKRPKIRPEINTTDRFIEAAGIMALILLWALALFYYYNLPETIPTHYNLKGEADNFGSRNSMFILPVIGTILYIGLTILNRYPHLYNFPVKITPENALQQYTLAVRLIRAIKLSMLVVFVLIVGSIASLSRKESENIQHWFLPLFILLIITPVIYYILKAYRKK